MSRYYCFFARVILLSLLSTSITCFAAPDDAKRLSGNVVQIAVSDIPVSFSPYLTPRLDEQYTHLFFDPLFRWRDEQQLEPRLVEKWEQIDPGVMRFYLKKNIKFHSGNDLTSKDVIWTYSQIKQDPQARHFFTAIDNIIAQDTDSFTVYSHLSETQVLDYLAHFFVLDAGFYSVNIEPQGVEEERLPERKLYLSGTGPYLVSQYNPYTHLKVIKNSHYWDSNESSLALNFLKIKSPNSRLYALLSSDVDISSGMKANMLNSIRFSRSKSAVRIVSPAAMFLTINDTKTAIFKQKEAREAINLAINNVTMLKRASSKNAIISAAFERSPQANATGNKPYLPSYRVDSSVRIFRQLKLPKQLSLLVMIDGRGNSVSMANAIAKTMLGIGIELKTTTVSNLEDWKKQQFNYDFTLSPWQSSFIDNKNIYDDICADSYLSDFIQYLLMEAKTAGVVYSREQIFDLAKQDNKIIPLYFQNQIWAGDNNYNLDEIFSPNGSPYWDLLKRK
ncbi:MAG: ABC transporter substrate-binding protein [Psychromonas sp.]